MDIKVQKDRLRAYKEVKQHLRRDNVEEATLDFVQTKIDDIQKTIDEHIDRMEHKYKDLD